MCLSTRAVRALLNEDIPKLEWPCLPKDITGDLDIVEDTEIKCAVCLSGDEGDTILLCGDGDQVGCDYAVHMACLTPTLKSVPKDMWLCSKCSESSSSSPKPGTEAKAARLKRREERRKHYLASADMERDCVDKV